MTSAITIPRTSEEITAEWLNEALAESGVCGGATIASISKERIGEGAGFVGIINRVTFDYGGDVRDSAPRSVIVKMPTDDEAFRNLGMMLRLYEREASFYEQVAADTDVSMPEAYYNASDPTTQSFVLALEDISEGRVGDQLASCTVEEAKLASQEVAKLHAAWWDSPRLAEFDWIPTVTDPAYGGLVKGLFQGGWPAFLRKQGKELPAYPEELVDLARRFGEHFDELIEELKKGHRTISRSDFRLDNMLFDAGPGRPIVIIDWQLCQSDGGMLDVTYFLGGSLTVEARREHGEDLVHAYHDALLAAGVTDYSFEECWYEYRLATTVLFVFMIANQDQMNLGDYSERGQNLFQAMFERFSSAILDAGVGEFLPE